MTTPNVVVAGRTFRLPDRAIGANEWVAGWSGATWWSTFGLPVDALSEHWLP
ncbi:MAG: hypothetical protein NTX57_21415 [Armatimonadetes bacterium]|nr:hypothetical protein [Armatimonadota bacterium]